MQSLIEIIWKDKDGVAHKTKSHVNTEDIATPQKAEKLMRGIEAVVFKGRGKRIKVTAWSIITETD